MFAISLLTVLLFAMTPPPESPLACNLKALSPTQRARQSALSRKLSAAVLEKREAPDGLTFRLSLADMSLPELGEWIDDERLCCPFLDFRLSLDREGGALHLSLTGRAGVKEFLISDFANIGARK
jgi:hypothetical protein